MQEPHNQLKRELTLLDGIMLVSGSMIGSGIFIVSANMLLNIGSAGWLILAWVLSSIITIMAAVSYGELSAMFPQAGGQYVYLKESYNKLIAFLYGWSFFAVIQTGTIAAVGVAFAKFTSYLYPAFSENNILFKVGSFKISAAQLLAVGSVLLLTFFNSKGVRNAKFLQTFFTVIKIASLFGLVILGFSLAYDSEIWNANWANAWDAKSYDATTGSWVSIGGAVLFSALAASMVGSLFSSDAWNGVTFISGEIKNPKRNVGLSLLLGTAIVSIVYVITNLMYLAVMPLEAIAFAPQERVAVVASQFIFGEMGTYIIAIMIMISTFGCNNGLVMAGARVYYTMAKDGLFFSKAKNLNKFHVPSWGLWIQGVWASVLCLTGKYGDLLDYVMIIVMIFYILTIYGLFILRKKRPDLPRPYKAFGYPIIPFVYIVLASLFCMVLLVDRTSTCGWGVVIMLSGIPIYYLTKKKD